MCFYESDGGNYYRGMLKVYCPKTHYVINSVIGERIDMKNRRSAKEFIRQNLSIESLSRRKNRKC